MVKMMKNREKHLLQVMFLLLHFTRNVDGTRILKSEVQDVNHTVYEMDSAQEKQNARDRMRIIHQTWFSETQAAKLI